MNDNVKNPSHYEIKGGYEVIDLIKDMLSPEQFKGYCWGNMIKYTMRWNKKNGIEDLEKDAQYIEFLVEYLKERDLKP